jgi:ribulose-phosphate 3-epimerase
MLEGRPVDIIIDGGVTADNAGACAKAGGNVMVAGSAVFSGGKDYAERIAAIRKAAEAAA